MDDFSSLVRHQNRSRTFVCALDDSEAIWAPSEVADTVAYGSMHYLKTLSEPKPNGVSRLEIEAAKTHHVGKDLLSQLTKQDPGPDLPFSWEGRDFTSEHRLGPQGCGGVHRDRQG